MSSVPTSLPLSATAAWWLTAWLRGDAATDDVLDALGGARVATVQLPDDEDATLLDLLLVLRQQGSPGAGLALPRPGDPLGLGGPAELNTAALEAGEAVVVGALGLVPHEDEDGVHWQCFPAAPRPLPDLAECSRVLRRQLLETAEALAALDVARWRPEAADLLMNRHHPPDLDVAPGIPHECLGLAGRGLLAWQVVEVAGLDEGGSLSAHEATARRDQLVPLERAARRAVVAACSPETWPPAAPGPEGR